MSLLRLACAVVLVATAILVWPATLSAVETVRTWTDATGTYTVRAKLVGFESRTVRLEKEDGSSVSLPLDRLSAADQAHVTAYDANNPFRPKPKRPGPGGLPYGSTYSAPYGSGAKPAGGAPATPQADPYAKASDAAFPPTTVGPQVDWNSTPTLEQISGNRPLGNPLLPALAAKPIQDESFALPTAAAGERLGGLWTDARDMSAMLGLWYEPTGKPVSTRAMRIDLSTGQGDKPVDLPAGLTPLGWDGRGNRVVCRDLGKGASPTSKLAVVLLTGGVARTLMQVDPYDGAYEQPIWAAFCEGERLATFSDQGRLVIWSITTGRALAHAMIGKGATVRRSEDARVVAVGYGSDVYLYDVATLSQTGGIANVTNPQAMAFSPDGTRIAVRAQNGGVWKLADMTKVVDLDGSTGGPMFFADSRSLYDGDRIVDAESGVPIWQIKGNAGRSGAAGDRAWFVFEDAAKKVRRIHPEKPRQGSSEAKIAAIGTAPQGDLLPPNQPIRVDVKLLPRGEDHAKVQAHLEASVRKAGHEVDEKASIALVATAFPREEPILIPYAHVRQATWDDLRGPTSGFGGFDGFPSMPGLPNVPAPPRISPPPGFNELPGIGVVDKVTIYAVHVVEMKLELEIYGETLWSTSAIPMQKRNKLLVPKDYTIEDFIQRLSSDDLQTFLTMSVPRSIPRGGTSQPAFGYYELSLSGLVPVKDKNSGGRK